MRIVILFLIVLWSNVIIAQTLCKKGTWMIGLNPVNYSVANYSTEANYRNNTLIRGDTGKSNGIGFALFVGAGYFVKDNLCIGAGFGNTLAGGTSQQQILLLPTELFARYYLMQKIHKFSFAQQDNMRRYAFFIEGTINGGYQKYNYTGEREISYAYGGKIAIGFTYMFTKHIAFEIMGIYNYIASDGTNKYLTTPSETTESINKSRGCNLLFGLQTYF